jgi:excisionase family DNA binding protein
VTPTPIATSLDLAEAAAFLGLHPDTLRERAASGKIPGAKVGKQWRFLEADLIAYFRSQYRGPACQSSSVAKSGTSTSAVDAVAAFDALLALPTGKSRSDSMTNLRLVYGSKSKRAGSSGKRSLPGSKSARATRAKSAPSD